MESIDVKKKRGRKPKESKKDDVINQENDEKINDITMDPIHNDPTPIDQKRTFIKLDSSSIKIKSSSLKLPATMSHQVQNTITMLSNNKAAPEPPEKKKRGRKPKSVYNVNELNTTIVNSSLSDDENVIVRLQVTEDNSDCSGDEHPYAYNNDEYSNMHEFDVNDASEMSDIGDVDNNIIDKKHGPQGQYLKIVDILKDFEQKNKNNEWPSNTSICCYWCCHKFENAPFGIPVSYNNGKFDVFGCFCSLECAAAYNFKSNELLDEVWERHNLINLLSRRINGKRVVKPAPDKMTLKIFGGFLDIDSFRNYSGTNKVININFPPMTSLTQQIEEINEYELNNDLRYIPLDSDRINRCREKMIFKRNKPLINDKTTLESSMNLKYN